MKKTSVYLEEEQARRLQQVARAQGRSQAEILRDAVEAYIDKASQPRRFALAGVAHGPGGSVADLTEEDLLRGFGG